MTVVGEDQLKAFIERQSRAAKPLRAWLAITRSSRWKTTQDIKNQFRSADFLSGNRVIFNIGGNNFRLVVGVAYQMGIVRVEWVGTHAEYDQRSF